MAKGTDYSDLEVGQRHIKTNEPFSTLQVNEQSPSTTNETHSTLQVNEQNPDTTNETHSTLQVNAPDLSFWDTKKELVRHYGPQYSSDLENAEDHVPVSSQNPSTPARTICGLKVKIFWIALVLSIIVVAAIIGGAVGGTVGKSKENDTTPVDDLPSTIELLSATTLSSAAWNDTSGTLQQRLYVQAHNNSIWELSWDSVGKSWSTSSKSIAQARRGSPLAAAVAYKDRTNQLNLYYIDEQGDLMQTNTTDHKIWHSSPVKTSNGTIARPANYSSLAATWYRNTVCADCSYNSFVVYQDSDSRQFQLVNTSTSGDVKYTTLSGNPAPGSGTAFGLQWRSNVQGNIRLSYQIDGGQLASTAWNSTTDKWREWETPELTTYYSRNTMGAPLTCFTFGRGAPTEVPDFLFILSAGNNGVTIDWWDNSDPKDTRWGTPQNPASMRGVRSLSPIAANAAGHVFAFEEDALKEFAVEPDGTTWNLVGNLTRS